MHSMIKSARVLTLEKQFHKISEKLTYLNQEKRDAICLEVLAELDISVLGVQCIQANEIFVFLLQKYLY